MCLRKYWNVQSFSVPIEKDIKNVDQDGNKDIVTITYKMKLINTARCMIISSSNLVNNLT